MFTKFMKWLSMAMLFLALLWRFSEGYQVVLQFVVSVGALAVVIQALRTRKYVWGAAFVAITVFFNPIAPFALSHAKFLWLGWASLVAFMASLAVLKRKALISMPSIVNLRPGNESL
ncbi:MAG: hypothetical protein PHX83_03875 [Acidobacteriia bacterium]|nr:hypothetical protein [Terriglobia bacterium]